MESKLCPSCQNPAARQLSYPEGTIYFCSVCQLQWADIMPEFSKVDMNITGVNDRYMQRESIGAPRTYPPYRNFFTTMRGYCGTRPMRILDIGCGNGVFLEACLKQGHDPVGIEVDPSLRAIILPDVIDRVVFGHAEQVDLMSGKFDVVTFWDSFEHMSGAFDVLGKVAHHLAPNGIVFIRVNNNWDVFNLVTKCALLIAPDLGKRLEKICFNLPQHAWNFSTKGMRNLMQRHGWNIVKIRITETPASRLSRNPMVLLALHLAYLANKSIGGGKIGEYYARPRRVPSNDL